MSVDTLQAKIRRLKNPTLVQFAPRMELIPPALLMAANLIVLWRCRAALTHRQRIAFLIYCVVPLVCMILQMFFYLLLMILN